MAWLPRAICGEAAPRSPMPASSKLATLARRVRTSFLRNAHLLASGQSSLSLPLEGDAGQPNLGGAGFLLTAWAATRSASWCSRSDPCAKLIWTVHRLWSGIEPRRTDDFRGATGSTIASPELFAIGEGRTIAVQSANGEMQALSRGIGRVSLLGVRQAKVKVHERRHRSPKPLG